MSRGDAFVFRQWRQAVDTGRVDQARLAAAKLYTAGGHLYRGARIVGDSRIAAGQGAKYDRFADVGVSDQDKRTQIRSGQG